MVTGAHLDEPVAGVVGEAGAGGAEGVAGAVGAENIAADDPCGAACGRGRVLGARIEELGRKEKMEPRRRLALGVEACHFLDAHHG